VAAFRHRRQVLLFLLAVVFPSAVLGALGLRIIGQERELAEKRLTDDRRPLVAELRRSLLGKLEAIQLDEVRRLEAGEASPAAASRGRGVGVAHSGCGVHAA
jgi:hypothetical protein